MLILSINSFQCFDYLEIYDWYFYNFPFKILAPTTVKQTIMYNLKDEVSVEDREQEVTGTLRRMCAKNTGTIDISVSKDFIELVNTVKHLSHEPLRRVYSSLESGRLCTSKKLT